jgi:ABC-type multidrug transport system fused ATPase/permease subunit
VKVREAVTNSLRLLSVRDRRLLIGAIVIQMSTSALDLVGVVLIGLVGAISITTIQSQPPPQIVEDVATRLGLDDLEPTQLVVAFSVAAAIVLLGKSLVSSLLTRRLLKFLANRQALVSARLSSALLERPLTFVQQRSSQETAFALISGAGAATMNILGQLVVAASEVALLVVLAVGLMVISPLAALASVVFFALLAFGLQRAMGTWASRVGAEVARADIASLGAVQEALSAYREITVSNRRQLYVAKIQELRWQAARVAADAQFINVFPKYLFEAALVVGGFALAAALFATQDAIAAVGMLALFIAAGSRVMPSLLRLQGAALGLRGSAGIAGPTFALAEELGNPQQDPARPMRNEAIRAQIRAGHPDMVPSVELNDITFAYPGAPGNALEGVSLYAPAGGSVALVGRSGGGKSTMADIILGVLHPKSGSARVSGVLPEMAVLRWPGGIAYVPQDVVLADGTIRENVALGLPRDAAEDDLVWRALDRAHLSEFLRSSREGLDTRIGEKGMRLSGGQRQRLGIARALYSSPRLLVLDEATSALDAETEASIAKMVSELEGTVTTVIIAHRLSTVRNVDQVVYLDEGRVHSSGTFAEVCQQTPALQRQAELMGLT